MSLLRRTLPFFCALLFLSGCGLPRVIVLHDPLDAREHNDLGVAYQYRQEFDLAAREYARAAELDRDWSLPLVNLGNVLAAQGDWPGAAARYRQALEREPQDAGAMNNLAWVLLRAKEIDAALSWAGRALALSPDEPAILDTLAEARLARGERQEAVRLLDQALSLAPESALRQALEAKRRQLPDPQER